MASVQPQSIDDVTAAIRLAISKHTQISMRKADGSSPSTVNLQLHNLNQIIDYPFDDMTITVQAGMTCAELKIALAEHNQQLPIDVQSDDTTVGQLVASNLFGPRVCGYGTVRDYLIGIQAIDGAGRVFRAGGKVVKNVAGYDLCRLMIGSHGRLGIITECTFKLNPNPTSTSAARLHFQSYSELSAALQALNSSQARPTIIDIHSAAEDAAFAVLVVGVEGSNSSCHWQLNQIQQECKAALFETFTADQVTDYLSDSNQFWSPNQHRIKIRRSTVAEIAETLIQQKHVIHGYAADGILHCLKDDQIEQKLLESAPAADFKFCDRKPSFSTQQHPLNARLLSTFDPHEIFCHVPES